jgi:hypothetical protein
VCDAVDGTNVPPGAMGMLANLVPSPMTRGIVVSRSAQLKVTSFTGPNAPGGPAQINALLVVGNLAYGMIAATSGAYTGYDVPFVYNIATETYLPIAIPGGAASLPVTPPTLGDWTPPTMAVVGSRIMVTHPGFPGGSGPYFGWLDISSFSDNTKTGTLNSTTSITALSADVLEDGWQPGMLIAGNGIQADTTIVSLDAEALDLNTIGTTAAGAYSVTAIGSLTDVVPGCTMAGPGIAVGALVESVDVGGSSVVMTLPATQSIAGGAVNFSGATAIVISQAATASAVNVALTVTGGTAAAPLWGSGNTNGMPLAAVPVAVAQFSARAWFAVNTPTGNAVVFSDTENPTQVSNLSEVQVLTLNNGVAVTALGGLPLGATTLGGIIQALIVFQASELWQITGDAATSNLSLNQIAVGVGCSAANTICPTTQGLAFVAADGLRVINFFAQVGDPIGAYGTGVWQPFLNAVNPTRMCAAYNNDTLRISVQNGAANGQPRQEFWYHTALKSWSGPHSLPAALLQPYAGKYFIAVAASIDAALWQGSPVPTLSDTYSENGVALSFTSQTALLPDTGEMAQNSMIETSLAALVTNNNTILISAMDEQGNILDRATLSGAAQSVALWGSTLWGTGIWGGGAGYFMQSQILWDRPVVFKQMTLTISGSSSSGMALGNWYMRYGRLGYLLPPSVTQGGGTVIEGGVGEAISAQ